MRYGKPFVTITGRPLIALVCLLIVVGAIRGGIIVLDFIAWIVAS